MKPRTCIVCGREYTPSSSSQKVCGEECRKRHAHELYAKSLIGENRRTYAATCVICGRAFTAKYATTRTCGEECGRAFKARRAHEFYAHNQRYLAAKAAREAKAAKAKAAKEAAAAAACASVYMTRSEFRKLMAEINTPPPEDLPMRLWRF